MTQKILFNSSFHVPFFWSDPAGILFFGYILSASHQIWEDWARRQPGLWSLWFANESQVVYPLRNTSVDFLRPMKFGVEYSVTIRLESLSASSFILLTEFSKDSIPNAVVRSVHTAVDSRSLQKTDLPLSWKKYLM